MYFIVTENWDEVSVPYGIIGIFIYMKLKPFSLMRIARSFASEARLCKEYDKTRAELRDILEDFFGMPLCFPAPFLSLLKGRRQYERFVKSHWKPLTCDNLSCIISASLKKGGRPMPTQTFFNLPPPKREKLLHAAVAEFARRPYGEVSISRIIQAAEIPRGSFYQYFTDKTDLFRHVLRCCDKLLETAVSRSLDSCGGKPMELPLALFDRVLAYIQANRDDFALFLGILRQNAGMDAGQLLALPDMMLLVLERADWSGLTPESREERLALLGMLLSCAGQALMAVCCCGMAAAECRRQLELRTALIRRGAEIKEDNPC